MAKKNLAQATLVLYRSYADLYEREGNGDPEGWLDSLSPNAARNGRSALRVGVPGPGAPLEDRADEGASRAISR